MTPDDEAAVKAIVTEFAADRSRLLDIVEAIQRRSGTVSDEAVQTIVAGLHIHAVEVEDMISFYAFFDRHPRGRVRIRLSKTPVSIMKGAKDVARAFERAFGKRAFGISMGETSADGGFTLQWTSDIGMADQEPAALVNGRVIGLTPDDVPAILAALHAPTSQGFANAVVKPSLVQAGPVLTSPFGLADGLKAALEMTPDQAIEVITASKLRGRGGAGFPTGTKWRLTPKSAGCEHYVACNADESEPGRFNDRVLLSEFPDLVFDGMTIAGYALGAHYGLVYLRGEYAYLWDALQGVLKRRRHAGLLGANICGHAGFDFAIRIQLGAGAYICGEESSMIQSLEGKRGSPRDRPPFPTERGYPQQPTAVDNVETYVCAAQIMAMGAAWFQGFGTAASSGTKLMSVSGDCLRPGVYEVPFGITVNELLDLAGGTDAAYVQVSGPSGQSVAPKDFGRRIAFEDLSTGGSTMVFWPQRDVLEIALQFAEFLVDGSCGWCVPCRVGLHEARLQPGAFAPRVTLQEALADAVLGQGRQPVIENV